MTESTVANKMYDKANSLLSLGVSGDGKRDVLHNLQSLKNQIFGELDKADPLAKALKDILDRDGNLVEVRNKFWLREHVIEELRKLNIDQYPRYLRYRYAYDVYPVEKIVSNYPPVVQIEPTSICNYRCVFCYQTDPRLSNKKNGHMGSMSFEMFTEVVDQLVGNVEGITLASRGEPTVNRKLGAMLSYLSGKFLATKLNTNASLLNEKLIHEILSSDLQTVVFSADAADPELYSKLRVNGNLERVLKNIRMFNEIKEKDYPNCRTITRVSGVKFSNEQKFTDIEDFWNDFVDQVAFVQYNPWENVYDAKMNDITRPCSDLWRRLFVWWDGKVAPCDVDYLTALKIGSVNERSIEHLWNSDEYQIIRNKHLCSQRSELSPCNRCQVV